ncbi:adenylate/guanylate cyclase domain-containing protein [Tsukamurella soli]|uniref:Adenylate/guanylate cyclase domain-containing protein n=1 Tax=Tsukamurella soli TaxID=644556 RepID=A0ABP8JAP6_9ACTN
MHPPIMRGVAAAYTRHGVGFLRRAMLLGQLGVAVVFAAVGPLLTRLFAPDLTVADLLILAGLALAICVTDIVFATVAVGPHLRTLEQWLRTRDPATAATAWQAAADVPFATLGRRRTALFVAALNAAWIVAMVALQSLPARELPLFVPGAILFWLYWLALRFMLVEQLVRPILADISVTGEGSVDTPVAVRITLAQRLFLAIPAITVIAGTVVAGVVGDHTIATVAIGAGVSIGVAVTIAGALVLLVTRSVTEPIADLRDAADRVSGGDVDVRVPVTATDEIGTLARSFNAMVAGLRERERIRTAFGTYVDRSVADHILAVGDDSLATGEEVEITAMFLDVRGFTGYTEHHPAREVVAMLNRLFATAVPIIRAHGGYVDKFVGDGLLAVFGVPYRHPDHAERALGAALAIAAAVDARPGDEPRIGIGLNSGTVVVGNIGGAGRFDFTVIGDAVNVAARVESATRQTGDTVLLSEHTHRMLPTPRQATMAARPLLPLKGKTEPVALYAPGPSG